PVPIDPDAPLTFSMITGWPSVARMPSAIRRALVSSAPPAGTGTTIVTWREGNACARTVAGIAGAMSVLAAACRSRRRESFILAPSFSVQLEDRAHERCHRLLRLPRRLRIVAEMRAVFDAGSLVAERLPGRGIHQDTAGLLANLAGA